MEDLKVLMRSVRTGFEPFCRFAPEMGKSSILPPNQKERRLMRKDRHGVFFCLKVLVRTETALTKPSAFLYNVSKPDAEIPGGERERGAKDFPDPGRTTYSCTLLQKNEHKWRISIWLFVELACSPVAAMRPA